MSGEIVAVISTGLTLGGLIIQQGQMILKRIERVEDKVDALGQSVHADFIEHLRREHKMGSES